MYKVMRAEESDFLTNGVNGYKWATQGKPIETEKLDNNYKLTPLLNRRSYNDHLGSKNFINLLDEESFSASLEQNNESPNAVLHNGGKILHTNEKLCRCLPSSQLLERGGKAFCFKASLSDKMSVDVASQSEFASQTLKPLSIQNLEWIPSDDSACDDCQNPKYKLKETSPGCLPSKKGKSKKLQRKGSGKMDGQEFNDANNNKESNEVNAKLSDENSSKVRRKSFISSVIKFAKFGHRKKKRSVEEEAQETSDDSNCGTESSEEKREDSSSYQDEEFIFGGVRVFFDENGEFLEVDDYHGGRSVSMCSDDGSSECDSSTQRTRTKFGSSDSLNLGYSGSFVS